ncbi:MAG: hypothetical protein AAGA96_11580, partial [Verrucomicrobiota bacterium]
MSSVSRILVLTFGGAILFLWTSGVAQPRVFTSTDGRSIEATLISSAEGQVTIQRTSDGTTFTLPATSFSLEDQAWIREQESAPMASAPAAGDWGRLVVDLPNPIDYLFVVGLNQSASQYRTGASEYDLRLPEGAWIYVSVRSAEDPR